MALSKRKATSELETSKTTSRDMKSKRSNTFNPFSSYPISHAYRFIEPGPVLLVSTGSLTDSTHNLMTLGFHMMMQHESPALIGITLGPWDASFSTLKESQECVLAVPSVEIAEKVVDIGNCSAQDSPSDVSKWEKFDLDPIPAQKVKAPLVGGPHILANIECVVEDMALVEKYSMWILPVVKAWKNPAGGRMFHHRGQGEMVSEGEVLDFKSRMVNWQEFLE